MLNTLVEQLEALLAAARKDVAEDDARWARLACGQDTEEAEESGRLVGHAEGLQAALDLVKAQGAA